MMPLIEPLELRSHLSSNAIPLEPLITSRGSLLVYGSSAADKIDITSRGNWTRVIIHQGDTLAVNVRFRTNTLRRFLIDSGAGNDLVQVSSAVSKSAEISGGRGNDILFQGSGLTRLNGNANNDVLGRPGNGNNTAMTLSGGAGDDLLQADNNDIVDGGSGTDVIGNISGGPTSITDIESSTVFTAGIDSDGILRVTGTDGAEEISIVGRGQSDGVGGITVPNTAQVTAFTPSLSWKPLMTVQLSDIRGIVLSGLGGDDTLDVSVDYMTKPTTVFGGAGDDYIGLDNPGTVYGGEGDDSILTQKFAAAYIKDNAVIAYGLTNLPNVAIYGDAGNDVITADANDFVDGGAGNDRGQSQIVDVFIGGNPPTESFDNFLQRSREIGRRAARGYWSTKIIFKNVERIEPLLTRTNELAFQTALQDGHAVVV